MPSIEIKKLVDAYDKDGCMAFEDEPGSWIKDYKDKGACTGPWVGMGPKGAPQACPQRMYMHLRPWRLAR